jgi:hypothetical protein
MLLNRRLSFYSPNPSHPTFTLSHDVSFCFHEALSPFSLNYTLDIGARRVESSPQLFSIRAAGGASLERPVLCNRFY